jgi:hypothetical protein
MVKESKHRIDKTIAKYDPFVNMIRAKYQQNRMKQKFQVPASQQYYVDLNIAQWASSFGLKYGQIGTLGDITKVYLWKWLEISVPELEGLHEIWILKGFTELQWTSFKAYMTAKFAEIHTFYSQCQLNTSKLFVEVEYKEPYNSKPKLAISVKWTV